MSSAARRKPSTTIGDGPAFQTVAANSMKPLRVTSIPYAGRLRRSGCRVRRRRKPLGSGRCVSGRLRGTTLVRSPCL